MSLSQEHQAKLDDLHLVLPPSDQESYSEKIKPFRAHKKQSLVSGKHIIHHPHAGLNPIVDAACHLFSFLTIMERIVKEPKRYIDLMELLYLCLSMGYQGPYRSNKQSFIELEEITSHLYKHIRAYRGNFSKALSPGPFMVPRFMIKRPEK